MDNRQQPMLWWVYDEDSSRFSTLPTGPFLVPAIILYGLFYLARSLITRTGSIYEIAGSLAKTKEWQRRIKRYNILLKKRIATNNRLSYSELMEFRRLENYLNNPCNK